MCLGNFSSHFERLSSSCVTHICVASSKRMSLPTLLTLNFLRKVAKCVLFIGKHKAAWKSFQRFTKTKTQILQSACKVAHGKVSQTIFSTQVHMDIN